MATARSELSAVQRAACSVQNDAKRVEGDAVPLSLVSVSVPVCHCSCLSLSLSLSLSASLSDFLRLYPGINLESSRLARSLQRFISYMYSFYDLTLSLTLTQGSPEAWHSLLIVNCPLFEEQVTEGVLLDV